MLLSISRSVHEEIVNQVQSVIGEGPQEEHWPPQLQSESLCDLDLSTGYLLPLDPWWLAPVHWNRHVVGLFQVLKSLVRLIPHRPPATPAPMKICLFDRSQAVLLYQHKKAWGTSGFLSGNMWTYQWLSNDKAFPVCMTQTSESDGGESEWMSRSLHLNFME